MNDGNIDDYYPNAAQRAVAEKMEKAQREEFLKQARQRKDRDIGVVWRARIWTFIEDSLAKDTNMLVQHRDRLASTDPEAVVFEVLHSSYTARLTLGELEDAMKKQPPQALAQYGITRGVNDNRPFTAEEKGKYFDWQITFLVLRYGAFKLGVVDRPEYKKELQKAREQILASMLTERQTAEIVVTPEEVRAEYETNPKKYVRKERRQPPVPGQDPFIEKQLGFAEAKVKIEADMKNARRQKILQDWQAALFKKYQVRILEEAFEILPPPKPKDPPKPEAAKKK
jgi:hypothetical protein